MERSVCRGPGAEPLTEFLELPDVHGIVSFFRAMTVPRAGGNSGVISLESVEKFNSGSQVWEHEGPIFPANTTDGWQGEIGGRRRWWVCATHSLAGRKGEKGMSQTPPSG